MHPNFHPLLHSLSLQYRSLYSILCNPCYLSWIWKKWKGAYFAMEQTLEVPLMFTPHLFEVNISFPITPLLHSGKNLLRCLFYPSHDIVCLMTQGTLSFLTAKMKKFKLTWETYSLRSFPLSFIKPSSLQFLHNPLHKHNNQHCTSKKWNQ
jgi:hypothetical protein